MATPQIVFDITDTHELVRIHGTSVVRKTIIATLSPPGKYDTIHWENADVRDDFHKSVMAYLDHEKYVIKNVLMKGEAVDVIPSKAPPCPPQHPLQGDQTPAYLDWLLKWAPIKFQNTLGVVLKPVLAGDEQPKDPRARWLRADVIRTDSRPKPGTHGGEYMSTRFKMRDQIIARRASHLTFTKKEILVEMTDADGKLVENTAPTPYEDRYNPDLLDKLEKKGDIEIVWKRAAAASAGANF
jgi:hypothetical protein